MSLSEYEVSLLTRMRSEVARRSWVNQTVEAYYDGSFTAKNLGIAVPPSLADIGTVSDWPSTVVDIHHERMQFQGWLDGGRTPISQVAEAANARLKLSEALLDSLIYGVGFLALTVVGDEPYHLHAASPLAATMLWDYDTDQPIGGYRQVMSSDGERKTYLYLPGEIVVLSTDDEVIDRYRLPSLQGRVPMVRLRNRLRPRRFTGQSEITRPVMYYTDAAVRTLLGMEINREFYTTPQRYALNADPSDFGISEADTETQAGRLEAGWRVQAGKMLIAPPPDMGSPEMKIGQFTPAPPTPYIEQIRTYSQLLASATGIPSAYLGFSTEQPPSADAIRAWTERLVRSVEAKIDIIRADLHVLGWMLQAVTGVGVSWEQWSAVEEKWRDPSTPTKAADADAAVKLVGAGILPPESSVTRDRVGLSPAEQRRVESEQSRTAVGELVRTLRQRAGEAEEAEALAAKRVPGQEEA